MEDSYSTKIQKKLIKGERSMSRRFVAQYAAEAALSVEGVLGLLPGIFVSLKEVLSAEHDAKGVKVEFMKDSSSNVYITVYPMLCYGYVLPELAWEIQERVKRDVERYTGLIVDSVDVQISGISELPENNREDSHNSSVEDLSEVEEET